MDEQMYQIEAETATNHWRFVAQRRLLSPIIRKLRLQSDAPILDLGSGTGTNLRMLRELNCRNTIGLDKNPAAVRFCAEQGLGTVEQGDVCDLPFEDARFALVLAADIVAQVGDDERAFSEIRRVLAPGGTAVITVPAFESLRGGQDGAWPHARRYRKRQLEERLRAAGLDGVEVFYFNYVLFFPLWLARRLRRPLQVEVQSRTLANPSWANRVLTAVVTLDVRTARWVRAPFGASILAIARRGRRAGVGVPARVEESVALLRPRSAAAGAYRCAR
jgi:SAM-dependent methyltransferase